MHSAKVLVAVINTIGNVTTHLLQSGLRFQIDVDMDHCPTVTIGMPVYNGERFIAEAIKSILSQSYENFELIVCDNASQDKTQRICRQYARKDKRIRFYQNSVNMGAAFNYNRTFRLARGRYFKWAAADDILAPSFLEKCIDILQKDKSVVLSYPLTVNIDEEGSRVGVYDDRLNLTSPYAHERIKNFETNIDLCNALLGLIRSEALQKTNIIGAYSGSDVVLLIELSLQGKIHKIPEYLFFRRDHAKNCRKLPPRERAKWFDPAAKGIMNDHPLIYLFYRKLLAIKHSQLPVYEKLRCYPQVSWWVLRKWRDIGGKYKSIVKKRMGMASCWWWP